MLIGSFLAGSVPLAFKLSESRLRYFSAMSVGLLMGTALLIIIPEGVETLYSASISAEHTELHKRTLETRSMHVKSRDGYASFQNDLVVDWTPVALDRRGPPEDDIEQHLGSAVDTPEKFDAIHPNPQANAVPPLSSLQEQEAHTGPSAHQYIGIALVLGFALMFLIDQISSLHVHGNTNNHDQSSAEFTELNLILEAVEEVDEEEEEEGDESADVPEGTDQTSVNKDRHVTVSNGRREVNASSPASSRYRSSKPSQFTPTVGLVVHAAADGIALGASARHPHLSFVIFFAIMIHKAPSAFALTTVLMNEGYMRARIRRHLLVFSMAAPIGAILTYAALLLAGNTDDESVAWWTGMLLLFSGGTFLYVAMHVLEEVKNHSGKKHSHRTVSHEDKLSRAEVICILVGMFIPAILNIEHGH
jgi:zinc transporter 9